MRRLSLVALLALPLAGIAHEVRPAYLQLAEQAPDRFEVTFKQPTRGDRRLPIDPRLPKNCKPVGEVSSRVEPGSLSQRWTVDCPGGIEGGTIGIDGLSRTMIDALVRAQMADGEVHTYLLKPASPTVTIEADTSVPVLSYLRLGIEHLVFGFDHVLFVVGLMHFVRGFGALLRTVTAFTLAHSITLALSALQVVRVSPAPVEAVIALSILFLAAEGMRGGEHTSVVWRKPWVVAFGFGLLHGFGFAGALADLGLPSDAVAMALFLFNVGLEIGQIGLICVLLGGAALYLRQRFQPAGAVRLPLIVMGVMSAFWTVQRAAPILG